MALFQDMHSQARIVFLTGVMLAAVLAWFSLGQQNRAVEDSMELNVGAPISPKSGSLLASGPNLQLTDKPQTRLGNELEVSDVDGCLSPTQLWNDPVLAEDFARFDSVETTGPTMASYRGLSSTAVKSLAMQGDSAAMAVLGAMAMMRGRNVAESRAVSWLLSEDHELQSLCFKRPLEPDVKRHYEDAAYWFYRSALHGRLFALRGYGDSRSIVEGNAVDLGWISQEDYDVLGKVEKDMLHPWYQYHLLAFDIAPELHDGAFGLPSGLIPTSDHQLAIREMLAQRFNDDLEAARLPPILVPEATSPSTEDMTSRICQSYR